jgi:hypothetical protein
MQRRPSHLTGSELLAKNSRAPEYAVGIVLKP